MLKLLRHKNVSRVVASARRKGNTATLLKKVIEGARDSGAKVEEIVLRDLKMSPCLEIYGCKQSGQCAIQDDFQAVLRQLRASHGIILASPIFFYTVSAHTKILMDRCQSQWVKKYWIERVPFGAPRRYRKGLFISVGATKGKKLFEGALLTVKYFFDTLDAQLWRACLYPGLDFEGDVLKHPDYLDQVYRAGRELAATLG